MHWVLGWVNYANFMIGLFDSISELGSSFWAEPVGYDELINSATLTKSSQLLLKVVDCICTCIKAPVISWNNGSWSRDLQLPPMLQCLVDGWSCGLFLLTALTALVRNDGWMSVVNNKKDDMHALAIQELITIP